MPYHRSSSIKQSTLTVGGSITVQLVSRLTGLDLNKQEIMLLLLCIETTESK